MKKFRRTLLPIVMLSAAFSGTASGVERESSSGKPSVSIPKTELRGKGPTDTELAKFSTKPIKIKLKDSKQAFLIPRNYFLPNNAADPDEKTIERFGFTLFLPDFQGYSLETARYYPRMTEKKYELITVLTVSEPAKYFTEDGRRLPARPSAWGDPGDLFELHSKKLELIREENGLRCATTKSWAGLSNALPCMGTRSNGELLFMWANDPPEVKGYPYQCDVQYYSEQEHLYVRYRYSRRHCDKWREIDDAIWVKLHAWRVK